MTTLEDLKKAGVVGMFIGPHPSNKLRLLVNNGDGEMIQDASRGEFDKYRSYLNRLESGEVSIPIELRVIVKDKRKKKVKHKIINDNYYFSNLEQLIAAQFANSALFPSPKEVWEGIQESCFDLKGLSLAVYMKNVYLYVCELRNDVKNDLLLRKDVQDRLLIDGVLLTSQKVTLKRQSKPKPIDQDGSIDKFLKACKKRKLVKGKTIPNKTLFEIAKEIMSKKIGVLEDFNDNNKTYHVLRQMASIGGYKKKQKKN